jgi:hypothetical protein
MNRVPLRLNVTKMNYMNDDTDTNFGWWTDKPERATRNAALAQCRREYRDSGGQRVWLRALLVIALTVAFGVSIVALAIR